MKCLPSIGSVMLLIGLAGTAGCGTTAYTEGTTYYNPDWAPPYEQGVRYYYLPDIETYYDLSDQEFVYLDHGQWHFSPIMPSIYAGYDLYNGFVIALNVGVFQPWMHHNYYVSHYPRFYYLNYYHRDRAGIRGFYERDRKPYYWRKEDRDRNSRNYQRSERKTDNVRPPQPPNYYGRKIGQPVKVRPQMKERKKESSGGRPH